MRKSLIGKRISKTLQKLLGHAGISMTMDLYVHVTEDEKEKEMQQFEQMCKMA